MTAGPEDRPLVVAAEQPVGGRLDVHQVLDLGPDAAEDPEHALDEQRRLDDTGVEEVRERVQMPDVVALELEAGPLRADGPHDPLDVREGVAKDKVAGLLEVVPFPVVLELGDGGDHRKRAEVHAAHVERADLGRERARRGRPLLQRHPQAGAGGQVDHDVRAVVDLRQKLREHRRVVARLAARRVARVQMHDRRPGPGRPDRALGDLRRGHRQVRRHRRDMDRAGHRRAHDDPISRSRHAAQNTASPASAGPLRSLGRAVQN